MNLYTKCDMGKIWNKAGKKSPNNGMWQVFTMDLNWHFVHCSRSFEQMKWNIRRNNRLANVNMDFFDGIVNKSENCVEKRKLLLMSLFNFLSLIICHRKLVNWRVLFSILAFLNLYSSFQLALMSPTLFFCCFSSSKNRNLQKKVTVDEGLRRKKNEPFECGDLVFFIQIFWSF